HGSHAEEVLGLVVVVALELELDAPLEQLGPEFVDGEPRLLVQLAARRVPDRLAVVDPAAGREPPLARLRTRGIEPAQQEHATVSVHDEYARGEAGSGRHTLAARTEPQVASTAATIVGIASRSSAAFL